MSNPEQMIAFWLVPARREKEFFATVIRELASRFDAPVFEPHVTLQGSAIDPAQALAALENVAAQTGSFDLEVAHLNFSEAFTKTVFVQFRASAEATALSDALRKAAGTDSSYEFDPHLSLLYKEMPVREKQEVAESIALPFERVQFDAVKTISCPATIKGREDVEAWQVLGERRLSDP